MLVSEVIEALADMPQDADVRFIDQPSWPFEHRIKTVIGPFDMDHAEGETVFLVTAESSRYLRPSVAQALGWQIDPITADVNG